MLHEKFIGLLYLSLVFFPKKCTIYGARNTKPFFVEPLLLLSFTIQDNLIVINVSLLNGFCSLMIQHVFLKKTLWFDFQLHA